MIKTFKNAIKKAMPKKASAVVNPEMPRLEWTATQADLMEFVYSLYLSRKVKDANGHPATINAITVQVFSRQPEASQESQGYKLDVQGCFRFVSRSLAFVFCDGSKLIYSHLLP